MVRLLLPLPLLTAAIAAAAAAMRARARVRSLDSLVLGIGGEEMLLNDLAMLRTEIVKLMQVCHLCVVVGSSRARHAAHRDCQAHAGPRLPPPRCRLVITPPPVLVGQSAGLRHEWEPRQLCLARVLRARARHCSVPTVHTPSVLP
jgi:hypothetical protein